ncbi:MAG: hypothetical protein WCO71_12230, partial [Pseudomonadota bacterium]
MFLKSPKNILTLALTALAATSCAPKFQGEFSDPEKVEIVDDKWNETDARKTSELMIPSVLGRPWYEQFKKS